MSATATGVTDESAFKQGSMAIQAVLAIVTLGLYAVYWWYDANRQFDAGTDADLDPMVQTVLFVIPLLNVYAIWKFSNAAEGVAGQSAAVLTVLFVLLPPAGWFLVQSGINGIAAE